MWDIAGNTMPENLVLGRHYTGRVPKAEQDRQRLETEEILTRLASQPGVVLADEVGMGKTFVALAVAYCVAQRSNRGPVIVMVPPNLVDKWEQDLKTFFDLYVEGDRPVFRERPDDPELTRRGVFRYGVARHSVDLLKLLDDDKKVRCHLVFLAQGAMSRRQTDKWVRLALIREALRRHGRGGATRLIKVKKVIHRFVADLIHARFEQFTSDYGEEVWEDLLGHGPETWMLRYNRTVDKEKHQLDDDPVPEAAIKAFHKVDLKDLADALKDMPLRHSDRTSERVANVRDALKEVENELWKTLLAGARWRSPLLVMDEAHHLKNPNSSLARQLQSTESEDDLRLGDGAMAHAFERMLFLTATPFQLGHAELVHVLNRFGNVRWKEGELGSAEAFGAKLQQLKASLDESQRSALVLQRCWSQLRPGDGPDGECPDRWWHRLSASGQERMSPCQAALLDAYRNAEELRRQAEGQLRPWIIRHNKGEHWADAPSKIARRQRVDGVIEHETRPAAGGIEVPSDQLLPFFLAARSVAGGGKDLLGDALCSSYEAFRLTRQQPASDRDEHDDDSTDDGAVDLSRSGWYLGEFDRFLDALDECGRSKVGDKNRCGHPKVSATVKKAVDLWEAGEKVLVFGFYRQTCRALRVHISEEIDRRMTGLASRRFTDSGRTLRPGELSPIIDSVQNRFFDTEDAPGRLQLDGTLKAIVEGSSGALSTLDPRQVDDLMDVMRRFLRVHTSLVRCFPIHAHDRLGPEEAVESILNTRDGSGLSWREKFHAFISFLVERCSDQERRQYLAAAAGMQTGRIRIGNMGEEIEQDEAEEGRADATTILPNVREATGRTKRSTRSQLMRAFNTPFFPEILVCSQVMGEGVDLQCHCRHVIHHDLAWNPSTIEQRTGRIDRLGCKAEGKNPINVYLPYIAGAADQRQYLVMSDREQWFRIVMGQDEVAKLIPITADSTETKLPKAFSHNLTFNLALDPSAESEMRSVDADAHV